MISERDYLKMRAKIEDDYRRDIEALDRVWAFAHKEPPPQQKKATPAGSTNAITQVLETVNAALETHVATLNKRASVRSAIQSIPGDFGSKDVRAALERIDPQASAQITDNQLSSIISRLSDLGEIQVIADRSGRTPATYSHGRQEEARAS